MADAKQRPDAAELDPRDETRGQTGQRPENQTDESKGKIKGEQVNDHVTPERWDTKRGAEAAMRGTSGRRG